MSKFSATQFILIKNAKLIASFDENGNIYKNKSILIKNGKISSIGNTVSIKKKHIEINASDMIILPGFINCWSYSWQSLFRNIPEMQNAGYCWLYNLSKRVDKMKPEDFYTAARTHYIECLLGGATTVVDCLYLVKEQSVFEQMIRAAKDVGIRLILVRGSVNHNPAENPFLKPFIQDSKTILNESEKLIKEYHYKNANSMCQIGLGPCTILTGTEELYRETANLARKNQGVQLYSILGEEVDEVTYCESKKKSLTAYMNECGWSGTDVVYINPVHFTKNDIDFVARTKTQIVDCPRSNARGTGITKLTEMLEKQIPIGIGTAGSAGNDRASMQEELLWTRYSQGARGLDYLKPIQTLKLGTVGGANIIDRDDLGTIEVGKTADLILYNLDDAIHYAGAVTDPIGSLVGSGHLDVYAAIINGQLRILDGKHVSIDIQEVIHNQNQTARRIESELPLQNHRHWKHQYGFDRVL